MGTANKEDKGTDEKVKKRRDSMGKNKVGTKKKMQINDNITNYFSFFKQVFHSSFNILYST